MASLRDVGAVEIVLTASCNLRCGDRYQNDKKSRRMDWEVLRPSLDFALASTRPRVRLLFIGGEPLLEMPSIERAVAYVEARRRADLTIQNQIITNGLLLGPEQASFLSEHDFQVQLSLDGVAEAQAVRGARSFEKLDALLDRLYDRNGSFFESNVSVAITLTPRTVPYLAESIEYFYRKHVAEITVTPATGMDAEWRLEDIDEMDRQFARVFRASLRLYRDTDQTPLVLFRKGRGRASKSSEPRAMCGVGRGEQLAIDVDGQVHGCLTFVESYQQFPMAFLRSRVEALRLGD